jgi:hypothetical protein
VVEAEGLLCRILEKAPPHAKLGAYVARGTARALARNLQRAHHGSNAIRAAAGEALSCGSAPGC